MIVANHYVVRPHKRGGLFIINLDTPKCPLCHANLVVRDSKVRKVKDSDGNDIVYHLRRLKCEECNKLHVELPDLMFPHKHYSRHTIEKYINENADCAADNKTLYRWRKNQQHT